MGPLKYRYLSTPDKVKRIFLINLGIYILYVKSIRKADDFKYTRVKPL